LRQPLPSDTRIDFEEDADNQLYRYSATLIDDTVLTRSDLPNERLRVTTQVTTPEHTTVQVSIHEVGLAMESLTYFLPDAAAASSSTDALLANQPWYVAIDQFQSQQRTGALVGAWSSINPFQLEPLLGFENFASNESYPTTGLLLLDNTDATRNDGAVSFISSELLAENAEIFAGTVTAIHADTSFVLAAKHGVTLTGGSIEQNSFTDKLRDSINLNPDTGMVDFDTLSGELLIFNVINEDNAFGVPYTLAGRVNLPHREVHGVVRQDDIALVANGFGGVIVLDISNLNAPYRVGEIITNGYARDVTMYQQYALIAAGNEGLVIADVSNPALPIIAKFDTFGIANRVSVRGDTVFVSDMAGDTNNASVTVVSLANPFTPELVEAREDLVADGVYDAAFIGQGGAASVHYATQEDEPAQAIVELFNTDPTRDPRIDHTTPIMVHRYAADVDFALRDVLYARGGVQMAAGRQGIAKVALSALQLVRVTPADGETEVALDQPLRLEFSHPLLATTDLSSFIRIVEGDARFGTDITSEFTVSFVERNGERQFREVVLTPNNENALVVDTRYVIDVASGLQSVAGMEMRQGAQSSFVTRLSAADAPDITAISPSVGGVGGTTVVTIEGSGFGSSPTVSIGGRAMPIQSYVEAGDTASTDVIRVTAQANVAGPAAVEVTTADGLSDRVLGGFTYVDQLAISFIDPPVVRLDQSGQGDRVRVVGHGFHAGVTLRAWRSGLPDSVVETAVDQQRLELVSSNEMQWIVPDFGDAYRGFVNVEIVDDSGERFLLENALFYGQLVVSRELATAPSLSRQQIDDIINGDDVVIPDATQLPPGNIVDVESDADLSLMYVLGTARRQQEFSSQADLDRYAEPAWISLVHYRRNALDEAAPLFGLGYFNLPPALNAEHMALHREHLYVAASGNSYPDFDTEFENYGWLLTYDRENRRPEDVDPDSTRDRDILNRLRLPFNDPVVDMAAVGDLLFLAVEKQGVVVVSLADRVRPSILRVINNAVVGGRNSSVRPQSLQLFDDQLHVLTFTHRLVFDIAQPNIPQAADLENDGESDGSEAGQYLVASRRGGVSLINTDNPNALREVGRYTGNGFTVPGDGVDIDAHATMAGNVSVVQSSATPKSGYLGIYDLADPDNITLLDALLLSSSVSPPVSTALSGDGVQAVASVSRGSVLQLIDTQLQDLVQVTPAANASRIPLDTTFELQFTLALTAVSEVEPYIELLVDDGTEAGQAVEVQLQIDPASPRTLRVTPTSLLSPSTRYRLLLSTEAGSRRTIGLTDLELGFTSANAEGAAPRIVSLDRRTLPTTGGNVRVTVKEASNPSFLVAGQSATVLNTNIIDGNTVFELRVGAALAGPAKLTVQNANGTEDSLLGAIQFVEPLELVSLTPGFGSINGGQQVTLKGRGLQPDSIDLVAVRFGDRAVESTALSLIDPETLLIITPPGQLGVVDVHVDLGNGQQATLENAYRYQQPSQAVVSIEDGSRIYDAELDPSENYVLAAAGQSGLWIFQADAGRFTEREQNPLTPESLLSLIDENGDGIDDRLVVQVSLPGGDRALGVESYFERGVDRILVTAQTSSGTARLHIIAFDANNIQNSRILASLPLPGNFARGIQAQNNVAALALGNGGFGVVDIFFPSKAYLVDQMTLPNAHTALDVARVDSTDDAPTVYAIAAGEFDIPANRLADTRPESGGLYFIENNAASGLRARGSVNVPASRVLIKDQYAWLAAGDAGLVLVDITDLDNPVVVARYPQWGPVHDIDATGNLLYLARGADGVLAVDITEPLSPIAGESIDNAASGSSDVVISGSFAAFSTGYNSDDESLLQVTPDVALNLQRITQF